MREVLLVGVALNFYGAIRLLAQSLKPGRDFPDDPQQYLQLKLFTAGTAAVFGCMYLYLSYHIAYAVPFLAFGAALKTWAFLLSSYLYLTHRLSLRYLLEFGVSNGAVGALFWWYLAAAA